MDFHIVVARFDEDTEWLQPFCENVYIQNKGDETSIPSYLKKNAVNIPNIGLDQYCYLNYIVTHYDQLPHIVIFTQAGLKDHHDVFEPDFVPGIRKVINSIHVLSDTLTSEQIIQGMIEQVVLYGYTLNAKVHVDINNIPLVHPSWRLDTKQLHEHKANMPFGDWFEKHVGYRIPDSSNFMWFKNAIFGVSKAYILSRPKAFYENILSQLVAPRSELDHYIERSWYYMLNLQRKMTPFKAVDILQLNIDIFRTLDEIIINSGEKVADSSIFFTGGSDLLYNNQFLHMQINLFNHAKKAQNILEVGFHAGHSSALMLLANPFSKILNFDDAQYSYTIPSYNYLTAVFPERMLGLVVGKSEESIPALRKETNLLFDLIYIDGSQDAEVVEKDIQHCKQFAAKDHVVIINNYKAKEIKEMIQKQIEDKQLMEIYTIPLQTFIGNLYHFIGKYSDVV